MKLKKMGIALLAAGLMASSIPAMADLVFPALSYRTGPFGANGAENADGYLDYFALLNERDGGIGGVKIQTPECETEYKPEKGVECYESTKGSGALLYQPLSTGITYQLIPKVTADKIPMLTPGYGRTSSANGKVFEYVFNFPANYWDGASVGVKYILDQEKGDLKGKKITLLYHNSAYGKEPIRTLEELSKKHGYTLKTIPVDSPGQEQKSQWLEIRRDKPDYVLMWGWGVMNQVAIGEAAKMGFPMDHFIGIWWAGSENDVKPAGEGANGYKALTFHGVGKDFPIFKDIETHLVAKGKATNGGKNIGTALYNRGLYFAMLAAEAAATAQKIHNTKDLTGAQMRDGLEALKLDKARLEALGLPNFAPEVTVSCENHGGSGLVAVQQWDAKAGAWKLISDFMPSDREIIDPLIKADSEAFAAENKITPRECK